MRFFAMALGFLLAASLALPVSSYALGLEVALGGWQQDPSGTISYKAVGVGDSIDLEKEAGFDEEIGITARAKLDLPGLPNVYLMATPMEFDGTGTKNASFNFGGLPFNANAPFNSSVSLDQYDIGLYYGIPFIGTATLGKLGVELGINFRILDFSAKADQPSTGSSASESFTLPVPMVYAGVQVKPMDLFSVEGEFRGMTFDGNDYLDFIARLKVRPIGPVFIAAGYRYQDINLNIVEDVDADIEIGGPFVEAGIEF